MKTESIAKLTAREIARFVAARPRSIALTKEARAFMPSGVPMAWMQGLSHFPPVFVTSGEGARFTDVDGHVYLDFNQADVSSSVGHGERHVARAVAERIERGVQFMLPVEDAIWVSKELGRRFGLSHWQYTLSASSANAEAIRLARLATGRQRILMFDGSYHGHIAETLTGYAPSGADAAAPGMAADHSRLTIVLPYNDLEAAEKELARGETACVIAEPALSNVGLVQPRDDFFPALRAACDRTGALLIVDETHTHMFAYGGLVRLWDLKPHIVVVGKNFAGGIAIGAYGMEAGLAETMEDHLSDPTSARPGLPVGGTLYGNALSFAAARAALEHVLTEDGYAHIAALGARLAQGIQEIVDEAGLPWRSQRLEARVNWLYGTDEPRSGSDAIRLMNAPLSDSRRIYMANRGLWEAVVFAGPSVSFPMTEGDVDLYLTIARDWSRELTS